MKTELKRMLFQSAISLCTFVNEHHITKENIQAIVEDSGVLFLFYWADMIGIQKEQSYKEGAEFGYNKAFEETRKHIAELEKENAELKSELIAHKTSDC